jgi:histidine triad (HIT) family protein
MDAPIEVHQMLVKTVKRVVTELGERAKDFRIMINNGPRSGQTVFHLHYHIMAGK